MRAAVVDRYGPPSVVRIATVPDPVPGRGEVRVRVVAASVNSGDARIRGARFPAGLGVLARLGLGLRRPRRRVLGIAFAGIVEAVGEGVHGVAVGDRVCGSAGMRMGAHAELVVVPASAAVPVPAGVALEDAVAVIFGGTTALHYLHALGAVRAGERVLVIGASGAVGTMAVQLARIADARVTAVCGAGNAELVRSLGADEVVDHRVVDVAGLGPRFDVVLDAVGVLGARTGRALLAPGGRLLLAVAGLGDLLAARGPVRAGSAPDRPEDVAALVDLLADGRLRAVTEAVLPLDRIAEAHERVDSGRKVGALLVVP